MALPGGGELALSHLDLSLLGASLAGAAVLLAWFAHTRPT